MKRTYTLPHETRRQVRKAWDRDRARRVAREALGVSRLTSPQAREVDAVFGRRTSTEPATPNLGERFLAHLTRIYTAEILRRGGEIGIHQQGRDADLHVSDVGFGLVLLHAEGWRQYSRRFGARPAALSYLCGRDDSGRWATRVPGNIYTVRGALDWITPAVVHQARQRGRQVLRQGDMYAVELLRGRDNLDELRGSDHQWDPETRTLSHPEHTPMHVPFFPVRFARQRELSTARGRAGD